jgi:hypothetical protein
MQDVTRGHVRARAWQRSSGACRSEVAWSFKRLCVTVSGHHCSAGRGRPGNRTWGSQAMTDSNTIADVYVLPLDAAFAQ